MKRNSFVYIFKATQVIPETKVSFQISNNIGKTFSFIFKSSKLNDLFFLLGKA
uniref:Uncharacterized protein n=1 Tax=Arundo donax TaxID=35708 RepID=A0A0A9ABT9_ARUDO